MKAQAKYGVLFEYLSEVCKYLRPHLKRDAAFLHTLRWNLSSTFDIDEMDEVKKFFEQERRELSLNAIEVIQWAITNKERVIRELEEREARFEKLRNG